MKPGLYPNLSRAEYDAIDAINCSRLVEFERTPAHARVAITNPKGPTEAMQFGTALHVAVLEPERFPKAYVVMPKFDLRTNKDKAAKAEFEAAHAGATFIEADDFATLIGMRDSLWSRRHIAEMLSGSGFNEVGIVFRHEETGLLCKGLMDRIGFYDGWTWIFDPKSTLDASRRGFRRDIRKFHYRAKAAFYLDGCNAVAPHQRRFGWIAIEKTPPYEVAVYEPDDESLAKGREQYTQWLRLYAEALSTGIWPGYYEGIELLGEET